MLPRTRAIQILILATGLWGLSFPATKALQSTQQQLLEEPSTWFLAAILTVYRFGLAAIVLLVISARTLRKMTRLELEQGLGLGLFGGAGILLQVDGLAHTAASTSAFLTQGTCLFIPLWLALRHWRPPSLRVAGGCALVIAGAAVLAGVDWQNLSLGRGEWETIAAAAFFAGQILWLAKPEYEGNNANHFSLVMLATMSAMCAPVAVLTSDHLSDLWLAWESWPAVVFLLILTLPCTLGAYMMMNYWQRHVTPVQAGLIYCMEPVFTSAYALFLPAIFSVWAGVNYPNEILTRSLVIGGAFILAANLLVLKPEPETKPVAPG